MSVNNSCGERQWNYDAQVHKDRAAETGASEIERLNHEILKYKVAEQSVRLERLAEKHLRDSNPAVKDAWEKYQTVLRLAQK